MSTPELLTPVGVHRIAPVSDEPVSKMHSWQVIEATFPQEKGVDPPTRHLVGYSGGEGRVCSAIQSFDKATMSFITRSGRRYEVIGAPGFDADAGYVWAVWKSRNGVIEDKLVTDEYFP